MVIDRLIERIEELNNPTVVGLDPQVEFVTQGMCFFEFNKGIIDAIHDIVPAVKPQIAFYERYGLAGLKAYFDTIEYAKKKGLIVIADIKRGDIASTAGAYADGHLHSDNDKSADFATVNPYMGHDSVTPWLKNCREYDKGLFVLVKTSNPGSGDFQDLLVDGKHLYEIVGQNVADWGARLVGQNGYSSVAAVVGATYPQILKDMRQQLPQVFFLVPGFGAQGGTAKDIVGAFDKNGKGAIINSSRGIIAAYKNEKYTGMDYAAAARQAAIDMRNELRNAL